MNTTTAITNKLPNLRGAAGEIETFAMANCLVLLSQQNCAVSSAAGGVGNSDEEVVGRVFPCKTCGKKFSSFQALGGHRASHQKNKLPVSGENSGEVNLPKKPKVHACEICGAEYGIGQALGGHMRRHRGKTTGVRDGVAVVVGGGTGSATLSSVTTDASTENSDGNNDGDKKRKINDVVVEIPVLKKSSSSKRVCLDMGYSDLDLNLTLRCKEAVKEEVKAVNKEDHQDYDNNEVEEGEIVEQDDDDFLKLELRCPCY